MKKMQNDDNKFKTFKRNSNDDKYDWKYGDMDF